MENTGPVESGKSVHQHKAFIESAEDVYDKIAEEQGFDENGDPVVDLDDDEPAPTEDAPVEAAAEDEIPEEGVGATSQEIVEPEGQDEPVAASESTPGTDEVHLPPHTWPQEWKDSFAQLTDEAKAITLEVNRQMNAGFTTKMTEIAELRRDMEAVSHSLAPHQDRLARAGISPDVAIQRALAWDAHIQSNPQQGIQDMAKAYGVDLAQAIPSQENQYLTPQERQMQQQLQSSGQTVQQLQQQMQQWQQHQQQQEWQTRQANAYHLLDEFMNAKDEKGNLRHPFIEHLAPQMTDMIQRGVVNDLEEAYDIAQARSPEIRTALEQRRKARQIEENKRKVEKARKASGGIVDKSGKGAKREQSFEQKLSQEYDKIVNA